MAENPENGSSITGNQRAREFMAPQINLPKGGGAIRGIDEKFSANPATGAGTLTVPIATSPGCSGFGPQLALLRFKRGQRTVWLRLEPIASEHYAQNR
jgi:hypothetical protein